MIPEEVSFNINEFSCHQMFLAVSNGEKEEKWQFLHQERSF
jgi:hypothetical protein